MAEEFTFESIDDQINALDLKEFEPGGANHFTAELVAASPAAVVAKICRIYRIIRPILIAIQSFPLIPPKWRAALKVFTGLMDSLCSGRN